jgi:hypothetical protein
VLGEIEKFRLKDNKMSSIEKRKTSTRRIPKFKLKDNKMPSIEKRKTGTRGIPYQGFGY